MVDESHVMLPQVRGMFGGDYSRMTRTGSCRRGSI